MNKLLITIGAIVLSNASTELKSEIKEAVLRLETKAKATKNPFDDMAVLMLKGLINMD